MEAAEGDGVANIQGFQCLSPEATLQEPVRKPSQHSLSKAHAGLAFGALMTASCSVVRLMGNLGPASLHLPWQLNTAQVLKNFAFAT